MYSIYGTVEEAISVNTAEAESRGCDIQTTKEWFVRINHPTDGRSALADGVGPVSKEQMIAEGFIQPPTESEQ